MKNNPQFRNSFGGIIIELAANFLIIVFMSSLVFVLGFFGIKEFLEKEEPQVEVIKETPKPKQSEGSITKFLKPKF